MPTPAPDATPPMHGFTGAPLPTPPAIVEPGAKPREWREKTPDGGYILWRETIDKNGKSDWRPIGYFPPPKGKET